VTPPKFFTASGPVGTPDDLIVQIQKHRWSLWQRYRYRCTPTDTDTFGGKRAFVTNLDFRPQFV